MKLPYSNNVLSINGLNDVETPYDCYVATLKILYTEFPKGYTEPGILLHTLYADQSPRKQVQCRLKLFHYSRIEWLTPNGYHTLLTIFSFLHLYFATYPNECLNYLAFEKAYKEFVEWAKEE